MTRGAGRVIYEFPQDTFVTHSSELPSAPYFAILSHRSSYNKPRPPGEKRTLYVVGFGKEHLSYMLGHKRLNRWYLVKVIQARPTLNPRKRYVLTSVGAIKMNFKEEEAEPEK